MSAALLPDSWGWLGLLTATGALFLWAFFDKLFGLDR